MAKSALITGITGQDGSYLAEFLLSMGYTVHGIRRRSSSFNTGRIDHLISYSHISSNSVNLHHADMTDTTSLQRVIAETQPDEIYNLAAQSHVAISFEQPEYTANCDALGTLRILEAIRTFGASKKIKFYQASTSELFGSSLPPQNECTTFMPRSPYAAAKLYSYWVTINYREAYNIFASNGILFNHESPRRGELFVTRKITRALCSIKLGKQDCLYLGNLEAKRDWGHASDYVEAMWKMLQLPNPTDLVIGTGKQYSVREFVEACCSVLELDLVWEGTSLETVGYSRVLDKPIVKIDKKYYRPTEVDSLLADPAKATNLLNWTPKYTFQSLVRDMINHDLELIAKS